MPYSSNISLVNYFITYILIVAVTQLRYTGQKNTIHQVTTVLTTSKNVLFQVISTC